MINTGIMQAVARNRGASGLTYGLLVGLISIVSLGAIQLAGESTDALMTIAADKLEDGTAAGQPAAPSPSPSPLPSPVVYTQSFTGGSGGWAQCNPPLYTFQSALEQDAYSSITLSGSRNSTGYTCTGQVATDLCNAMRNETHYFAQCNGLYWSVSKWDFSGGDTGMSILASAAGYYSTAGGQETPTGSNIGSCISATPVAWLRPCIGNSNWGGIDGDTCSASSQTITLTCE